MSKRDEYIAYIRAHKSNVIKVWGTFEKLNSVKREIRDRMHSLVVRHDNSKYKNEKVAVLDSASLDTETRTRSLIMYHQYKNEEFEAYRNKFFPEKNEKEDKEAFALAWNHHQKSNKHHWQYWIMWKPEGSIALEMDYAYILEMLCDWTAMSLEFKQESVNDWYHRNKKEMLLAPHTREVVEETLPLFDEVIKTIMLREKK